MRNKFGYVGSSAFAALLVSGAAHAAISANVAITGSIVPSPCSVSVDKATVNVGNIKQETLTDDPLKNHLQDQPVTITYTCAAATQAYVKFIDNRAGSEGGDFGSGKLSMFGLGLGNKGKAFGGYQISQVVGAKNTIDGVTGSLIDANPVGAAWAKSALATIPLNIKSKNWFSVSAVGSETAGPAKAMTTVMPMVIQVGLNAKSTIDFSAATALDGQFTVELYTL